LTAQTPHILLAGTLVSFIWIIISQILSGWKSHVCENDWGRKQVFTVIKISEWTEKCYNFFLSPVHLLCSPSDCLALSSPLPEDLQLEKLVVFCWLPGHFLAFRKLLPAIMADFINYEVFTLFQI
jgi:hypothetical protein